MRIGCGYDAGKENAIIELSHEQQAAMAAGPQPPVAIDTRTGQEYLMIRREVY